MISAIIKFHNRYLPGISKSVKFTWIIDNNDTGQNLLQGWSRELEKKSLWSLFMMGFTGNESCCKETGYFWKPPNPPKVIIIVSLGTETRGWKAENRHGAATYWVWQWNSIQDQYCRKFIESKITQFWNDFSFFTFLIRYSKKSLNWIYSFICFLIKNPSNNSQVKWHLP